MRDATPSSQCSQDEPFISMQTATAISTRESCLTTTDENGEYAFTGLAAGTHLVRQVLPAGWLDSVPGALSVGSLVAIGGYRDLVLDSSRGLLYATTDHGTIERIDLQTKTKLASFSVGTNLYGADITPDGRYLYVTEGQPGTLGVVYRVDLETGSSTSITYA